MLDTALAGRKVTVPSSFGAALTGLDVVAVFDRHGAAALVSMLSGINPSAVFTVENMSKVVRCSHLRYVLDSEYGRGVDATQHADQRSSTVTVKLSNTSKACQGFAK